MVIDKTSNSKQYVTLSLSLSLIRTLNIMGTFTHAAIVSVLMLTMAATMVQGQGTRVGFYSSSCPRAETIVRSTVQTHFRSDSTIAPNLLRMHFHDCFVEGCDGSILLDGASSEKSSGANLNLKGYDVIDDAKTQLEAACPGVVSCADILALATRDAVVLVKLFL